MKRLFTIVIAMFALWQISSAQFVEQTSGVTTALQSVSAVTDQVAWTCGVGGKVLRTTNGGTNWLNASGNLPTTTDMYNIFGLGADTALVTGSPATGTMVWKTVNGGTNWTQVFAQTGGFMDAIWMMTSLTGFMYGDPVGGRWSLWKTSNGGNTWDSTGLNVPQVGSEAGWNNAMHVLNNNIWFGTNNSRIYYSATGTLPFSVQPTPQVNSYAIWFSVPLFGLSGGAQAMSTSNNGVNWTNTATAPGAGNISGITGTGITFYLIRQATSIYRTDNNGANWTTQYTAPAGNYYHIQRARLGNRIWAVRSNGGISMSTGIVGVTPITGTTPDRFELSQNYPNPFNPSTTIRFAIPNNSLVTLKIYDAIGREVETLVNEFKTAGTYDVNFNAANVTSGIYFYTISAGDFKDTKKMILVK
ncbi:MAG: T9SS C-terminal target domain-containing protein [Ignavibacteriae bacterium]|nr:MAG: T9SS C-terminal target domain-containing protein [Ignavibacteriota bacterium]